MLTCHGLEYDGDLAATSGHFMADLGFEHFFTGQEACSPREPPRILPRRIIRRAYLPPRMAVRDNLKNITQDP